MAKLCIYNEICNEEDKVMLSDWFGTDGVTFKDIHEFLGSMDADDDEIDLRLHSPGGNCMEGWAIYDALRTSGKTITATIDGECSSMATIILLAAPLERRFGNRNASLCIHNPSVCFIDLWPNDRITADELERLKGKLTAQQQSLLDEQNKILDLYVERTGANRDELQALMNEDKYIGMERAIELGFISETVAPNTASKRNHKSPKAMKETKIKQSALKKLLALAGFGSVEDVEKTVLDQKITAADGSEFTVEREDGDPQEGDTAYPDGTYTLDDGTVITIENETISSIVKPSEGGNEETESLKQQVADLTAQVETLTNEKNSLATENETLKADKATLEQQVTDLTAEKDALTADKAALTTEKDTLAQANADLTAANATLTSEKDALTASQKTDDEQAILDIVSNAGGKAWLDAVKGMKSTFHAGNRSFHEHKGGQHEGETATQRMLREKREEQEAKRKARK